MLQQFYIDNKDMFCRRVYGIVKDWEAARDIVSTVFYNMLSVDTNQITDLKAYVFVACRNRAIDHLKAKQTVYPAENLHVPDDRLLRDIIAKEHLAEVRLTLERLPEQRKQVLKMFYFGNHSIEEIANILGLTTSHVRSTKAQALQQLRSMMNA